MIRVWFQWLDLKRPLLAGFEAPDDIEAAMSLTGENGTFIPEPYQFSEGGPGGLSIGSPIFPPFPSGDGFGRGGEGGADSNNYGNEGILPPIGG